MLKNFILLISVACAAIFAATKDEVFKDDIARWARAHSVIQSQHLELVTTANDEFKGQSAPLAFFTSQPKKGDSESDVDFKKRMVAPTLLCKVGWEGTLFLMSNSAILQQFFDGPNVPLVLKREAVKGCISKIFKNLESAAENGQLGAVLYFLLPLNTVGQAWQLSFANGFLRYCQKNGHGEFSQYVLHHPALFFSDTSKTRLQVQSWKAQCFATAFVSDLRTKRSSLLETASEMVCFNALSLKQAHVDALYVASAELAKYELMDSILMHPSWPKPLIGSENFALQAALNSNHYGHAKWMLTVKAGRKPAQEILDRHVEKDANAGAWPNVDKILKEVYGGPISASQELTDVLYICAAAYANEKYLTLLTSEAWGLRPTQKAKDDAFVHACMNNHISIMRNITIESTIRPTAFDKSLTEAVRYRHKEIFDNLLSEHSDQLSEAGMRAALEQAGQPSQSRRSVFEFDLLIGDNHYQKSLKEKLGIVPPNPFEGFRIEPFTLPRLDINPFLRDDSAILFSPALDGEATAISAGPRGDTGS